MNYDQDHFDDDIPFTEQECDKLDPRSWETVYQLSIKTFPDGQQELIGKIKERRVDDFPHHKTTRKAKRGEAEGDAKEKSIRASVRRAKSMIRQKAKAIGADHMVTLTVRENVQDVALFNQKFKNLMKRLNKAQHGKTHYVATVETQQRGALHIHMAVCGRQNIKLIRSIWQSEWGGKGMAAVNVRSPYKERHLRHRIASYIAKYIDKGTDESAFNKKRYWSSKGIEVPVSENYRLNCFDKFDFVTSVFSKCFQGRENERPQYWWSEKLGIFWAAIGPQKECFQ